MSTRTRTWSADETAAVFSLASENSGASAPDPAQDGLTLDELVAVGREAGLDPERVARAAAEVEQRRTAPVSERVLGAATLLQSELLVDKVTDEQADLMVVELEKAFGTGEARLVAGVFTWSCTVAAPLGTEKKDPRRQQAVRLVLRPRGGRTLVQLEQTPSFNERSVFRVGLAVAGALGILGAMVLASHEAGGAPLLALSAASGFGAGALIRAQSARRARAHPGGEGGPCSSSPERGRVEPRCG